MTGDIERDDQFTKDCVEAAARKWGVNPQAILVMMAARTHPGPVVNGLGRDLTTDAKEEFADAPNYITWDMLKAQRLGAPGLPVAQYHYLEAIAAAVYAFEQLRTARSVLWEACNRCGGILVPAEGEFIPVVRCQGCGREIPR